MIVDGFKSNEEALTQNLQIAEEKLKQNEAKYESLKTYAKSQIEKYKFPHVVKHIFQSFYYFIIGAM